MKKKHGDTTIAYFDTRILLAVILLAPLPIMPYQTRILRLSHPHVFIMSLRTKFQSEFDIGIL